MKTSRVLLLLAFVFALLPVPAAAQGPDGCPESVLLALARAGAVCHNMEHDQACYGNGALEATFQPGAGDVSFGTPGDIVDIAAFHRLRVGAPGGEESDWSVATLQIRADLVDTQQRSVTLLAFGDVELENTVLFTPELTVAATGTLYIRTGPEPDAEIVERLGLRETAVSNGRTQDGNWLRIIIPGTNDLGWVSRGVVTSEGDISALNVVDETTPFYLPFQVFMLSTGMDDAPCDGAPESGLLIQTPNTFTEVELTVNGTILRLAATVFLQAQPGGTLTVNVLDGQAEVEAQGTVQFVPASARVQIALDSDLMPAGGPAIPEPYAMADLQALPLNNLSYRFSVQPPLTQAEINTLLAAHAAPTPTPAPADLTSVEQRCERKTHRNASLWAGPGMFYEIVNPIASGTRVDPVFQVTDADGFVWWQLRNGNWIRADAVTSTGECDEVPVTDYVRPPAYNHLSLETCTTSNGPLRVGQWVTIDFVPPAFETAVEALQATQVDPGRITVNSQELYVTASNPIEIAEERYVRTFFARWEATTGSHRIVGQRLSYIVICDVTVPIGR